MQPLYTCARTLPSNPPRFLDRSPHPQAQRVRTRCAHHFQRVFANADFILTPSMPLVAPLAARSALRSGESSVTTTVKLMTYMLPANFLGYPAITVPVGLCGDTGAPVGLQIMGRHWQEASLLQVAAVLEAKCEGLPRPPGAVARVRGLEQ